MSHSDPWLQSFVGRRVLILGDVMIDRYVQGQVSRVSPEAPVPVVEYRSSSSRLGGAANVALNVREMGAEPVLVAVVGDDAEAQELEGLVEGAGLSSHSFLIRETGRKTTIKTRIIAGNQHLLRVDSEDTHPVSTDSVRQLMDRLEEEIQRERIDVIVLQDYDKGVLSPDMIQAVIQLAQRYNTPVTVDPKFRHFLMYGGCTLFKPNLKELSEGLAREIGPTLAELEGAVRELAEIMPHQYSLITLSDKGIFWYDHPSHTGGIIPPETRDIVDVCGAGDTVIAVASLMLASGKPLARVAAIANLAGGLVCERVGVVPVDAHALANEVNRTDLSIDGQM
ncbi:MAG: carbohydrate kinase [Saprospiraceae bacterium]|nr:carbohydrate kinase [Saprospiraceae bacterium]